jgi:hypothetical protein
VETPPGSLLETAPKQRARRESPESGEAQGAKVGAAYRGQICILGKLQGVSVILRLEGWGRQAFFRI